MIALIDNTDSFTYNIAQYLRQLGQDVRVFDARSTTLEQVVALQPTHLVISPGPGHPRDASLSLQAIDHFLGRIPILGICLGHQCLALHQGGRITHARDIRHGKASAIEHDGRGVFQNLESPFQVIRYHSLAVSPDELPESLEISARTEDGEVMALRHRRYHAEGLQFHPESIGTEHGLQMLEQFLNQRPEQRRLPQALRQLLAGSVLSEQEAETVMDEITAGSASPAEIGAFLTALALRGEQVEELTGFARTLRRKASGIPHHLEGPLLDTCGTGGDQRGTFNISTASALVAAGAGVKVAKHGNRSVSSRSGSADVLELLGVNLRPSPEALGTILEETGIAFLFAPSLHRAMGHVAPVRKALGFRTVFNLLGPLANPARATCQLLGTCGPQWVKPMGEALARLGTRRALVVHGEDGLDEITLTGRTFLGEVRDGWVRTGELTPRDLGLPTCRLRDIQATDAAASARIILGILDGQKGPCRDVVLANAGAAIHLAGLAEDLRQGVTLAARAIDSGAARSTLDRLVASSNR